MKIGAVEEKYTGIWPVMLTPFHDQGEIDWVSLEKLIDWYCAAGVHGLFAACQSSEMLFLNDDEIRELVRFVLKKVDGRIPVVASGHTACDPIHCIEQLSAIGETGVDAVILVSNRLAPAGAPDQQMLASLQALTSALPQHLDLGLYECPIPYKRLLSDPALSWCAESNRYVFLKDTSCSLPLIKHRLHLAQGSRLQLANANSQTLLSSFQAGCRAYSGVMANFHPALYVWLFENWENQPHKARQLADYLSLSALSETLDYPACAKFYQTEIGNFRSFVCRSSNSRSYPDSFYPLAIESMIRLGKSMQDFLQIQQQHHACASDTDLPPKPPDLKTKCGAPETALPLVRP